MEYAILAGLVCVLLVLIPILIVGIRGNRERRVLLTNILVVNARMTALIEWLHSASLADPEVFAKRERAHFEGLQKRVAKTLGVKVESPTSEG